MLTSRDIDFLSVEKYSRTAQEVVYFFTTLICSLQAIHSFDCFLYDRIIDFNPLSASVALI